MKKILVDSHVLIWWLSGNDQLGPKAREQIADPDNKVFVSAATTWEISIKQQMGKLKMPDNLAQKIEQAGFSKLPITLSHGQQAGALPTHHKDPFDRMLIAQAQDGGLVIMTKDEHFPKYEVELMDARD